MPDHTRDAKMSQLTQDQTAQVAQLLRGRERVLRAEIREGLLRSGEEDHKELAGRVSDVGDESVANLLADLEIAAIDRDVNELREVEAALARISRDDFGVCIDCGEPVGFLRLKASPAAVRCHACQSRRERGYAHAEIRSL
jgi:RNA polymerase-binding transcription factor DksA